MALIGVGRNSSHLVAFVVMVAAALLAAPEPAGARIQSVHWEEGLLDLGGTPDADHITIRVTPGGYEISDPGGVPGGGICPEKSSTAIECPADRISVFYIFTDAADDTVTNDAPVPSNVDGGDGNDVLDGKGADQLIGGAGDDKLFGQAGDDQLRGGPGTDKLSGGRGRDRLACGGGRDIAVGGGGKDSARSCEREKSVE